MENPDQAVGPSLGIFLTFTWLIPTSFICLLVALLRGNWLQLCQQEGRATRVRGFLVLAIFTILGGISYWFFWVFLQEGVLDSFPSPLIAVPVLLLSNMQLLMAWLVVLLLLIMLWWRTWSNWPTNVDDDQA